MASITVAWLWWDNPSFVTTILLLITNSKWGKDLVSFLASLTHLICFLKITLTLLNERHGERSCWNIRSSSGNLFLMSGMTFLQITFKCIYLK